jgi:flagellin-like protein
MQMQRQESGVSPVIGIILMVAVTVGLVALASTIVFDLGNNVNEPADVSVNLNYDEADRLIESGSGYELVWKRFACYNEQCMEEIQKLDGDRTEIARTKAVKIDDDVEL